MTDNVTLNSGSGGATLATDEIGGIQHQRVKLQYGADGSATDVSEAAPLPIVQVAHSGNWSVSADYATAQTNTTVKAAPGAGQKLYITDVIISNGATAGNITLLNGSGGSVLVECYPAINGGLTASFNTPLELSTNTLLAITSTTVTTHTVTVSGYTAA